MTDKWSIHAQPDGSMTVTFYDPRRRPLTTAMFDRKAADEFRTAVLATAPDRQESISARDTAPVPAGDERAAHAAVLDAVGLLVRGCDTDPDRLRAAVIALSQARTERDRLESRTTGYGAPAGEGSS